MKKLYPTPQNLSIALLFIIFCLCINTSASAQKKEVPVFSTTTATSVLNKTAITDSLYKKFKQFEIAAMPTIAISNFLKEEKNEVLPFVLKTAEQEFQLQLQPADIVGKNFKLIQNNGKGEEVSYPVIENIFYKGFADADKKNLVRLTIKDGLVSGFIQQNGEEFFIESLKNYNKSADKNDVIIYKTKDVIDTYNLKCGATDREEFHNRMEAQQAQQKEENIGECLSLKVIFITDYAMYSFFNGDVTEMQNKLLAVLNNTQGAYSNFDFSANDTVDVGDDELRFQLIGFYISTCINCDILPTSIPVPGAPFFVITSRWVSTNFPLPITPVTFYWTSNQIRVHTSGSNTGIYSGIAYNYFSSCTPLRFPLMACHYEEGDAYLRQLAAHELGHNLGATHDDVINPSVRNYIMNSRINPNSISFSTIQQFPERQGLYIYSSKLRIKQTVRKLRSCILNCDVNPCLDKITNLKAKNLNGSDTILVSWEALGGTYNVKVRESSEENTPVLFSINTVEKSILIPGLQTCKFYTIEVDNICGFREFISIGTSNIKANNPKVVHERNSLHDVEVTVYDPLNFNGDSLRITVDHQTKYFRPTQLPAKIILKDIFSDGARHRIDVYEGSTKKCRTTLFYQAPYYREDASLITKQDFNECGLKDGWKDSVERIFYNPPFYTGIPFWEYKPIFSTGNQRIVPGTIDSSCMINFSNFDAVSNNCRGSIALVSPLINIDGFRNTLLSFDSKTSIRKTSSKQVSFEIHVFNGQDWITIYRADTTRLLNANLNHIKNPSTFWDTLPARKFFALDQYNNPNLRIRFVVDDSSSTIGGPPRGNIYVALDNIRIDGYAKTPVKEITEFTIFPNPARQELYIKTNPQGVLPDSYQIFDATGRLIERKKLFNARINVERLSAALYFIQFFDKDGGVLRTTKFLKE